MQSDPVTSFEEDKRKIIGNLKAKINDAFQGTLTPASSRLVDKHTEYDSEYRRIELSFAGRQWCDLDERLIQIARMSLFFFSAEGFRYFLPGLMVWILDHFNPEDTLPDSIMNALTPRESADPKIARLNFEWVDGYSAVQREAIRSYLTVFRDCFADRLGRRDADAALRFWNSLD